MTSAEVLRTAYQSIAPHEGLRADALVRFERHTRTRVSFGPRGWLSAGATAMLVIGIVLVTREQSNERPATMSPWSLSQLSSPAHVARNFRTPHRDGQPLSSLTGGTGALVSAVSLNNATGTRPGQPISPGSHSTENLQ